MRAESEASLEPSQAVVADSGLKAMIPIGRPFLDYTLNALADAGFRDACLVIGPEHDAVREYYRAVDIKRIRVQFSVQQEPRGTADAVLAAETFVGGGNFVSLNSDNYYPVEVLQALANLGTVGAVMFDKDALVRNSNIPPDRIRSYAYGTVDEDGYLLDLVEKPEVSLANRLSGSLVSMNCWQFDSRIFNFCRRAKRSLRGEYELPGAVRDAIKAGIVFRIIRSEAGVLDLSHRSDIASVAERLKNVRISL
jgi:glucose-1-phosphate thymidylyltransferase